ncbi:MAG: RNA-binding protein [Candidatus Cloacimonetes bacterium]|nr:RNA-binding protein [Candidatus Cloacimonadota bacterium]MCF7815303.1 RNA-binding protein [Candidatus Cloacimonadota bacterium]MCF7868846.1 RNA-binding protein [Candidatus Cloacimonadota bacterium]MCF7884214.1 RNA-binding protein [Candidatus Cloacimonadota bacterium]
MRIDQLLNKLCLVKTRSIAKKACDKNLVKINGKTAKASANVLAEDEIEYSLYSYRNILKIIKIPKGNVSKNNAPEYYEFLEREKLDLE